MRYKLVLSYSGKDFFGWQSQSEAPSVQEAVENALHTFLGSPIAVVGAGRTDTEVSAVGYVAHFEFASEIDANWLLYKLNAILPPSIAIRELSVAAPEFHARFDAVRREYTYFLHRCKDPFIGNSSYLFAYPSLDFELMNHAAELLVGTHDFSCFQKTGSDNKSTICTVFEASWHTYTPSHIAILGKVESEGKPQEALREALDARQELSKAGSCDEAASNESEPISGWSEAVSGEIESQYWYFRIAANRFLRNMVRAIVGTLLEVGRGKRSLENFAELINGGSRAMSGESAPGHALFLSDIKY